MRNVSFCNVRFNPAVAKFFAMLLRVVCAVCIDGLRVLCWMSWLPGNRWHAVNKWKKLRHIVSISPGQNRVKRKTVRIRQKVMFASRFASIRWIWAYFFAPADRSDCAAIDRGCDQSI